MTDNKRQNRPPKKAVMLILDGWGLAPEGEGNALSKAKTPNLRELAESYPGFALAAGGRAVSLDPKMRGDTRRGSVALGMGRAYLSPLEKINASLLDKSFFKNQALLETVNFLKKSKGALHLAGVMSADKDDFAADYLYHMLALAARKKLTQVYIHLFLPNSNSRDGEEVVALVEDYIDELGVGKLVSLTGGSLVAVQNRDKKLLAEASGVFAGRGKGAQNIKRLARDYYRQGGDDAGLPIIIKTKANGDPLATVGRDDALVFFNAEPRAAGVMDAVAGQVEGLAAVPAGRTVDFSGYLKSAASLYETFPLKGGLVKTMIDNDYKVALIGESEKCAALCYYFTGGRVINDSGCRHIIVSSPNSDNYAEEPAMGSQEVAEAVIKAVAGGRDDLIIADFASLDALGYTGDFQNTVAAAEELDQAVGKIAKAVLRSDGMLLITASHGWAEAAFDPATDSPNLNPSANAVPFIVVGNELTGYNLGKEDIPGGDLGAAKPSGALMDVAPTILKLFNLEKPDEMTGQPLF